MTAPKASSNANRTRLKLALRGGVQGVGFRPFVYRLAQELGLTGWVNNSPLGVFIEAEGSRPVLNQFLLRLDSEKPPRSFIQSLENSWLDPVGYETFEIRDSESSGARTALVLPDIATCPECLREIRDRTNRRYRYPFTNCTNCGPRFSIIESLPYDRANTSMCGFRMCSACQAEYDDPTNRRFHAQPNACPVCGPQLELWDSNSASPCGGDRALLAAAQAICQGRIVAVKGIGGFHLMVDARDEAAVQRLRERKHREEKPFAVMFPTLESVRNVCEVSALEQRLLCSPEAPIVLLRKLRVPLPALRAPIAPGNPHLGVMLPSNPLHHVLLAELGFPVVATSGNLGDEPICTDEREALDRLHGVADVLLVHNRPIVRHVDDSIVRVMLDREMVLRRARGYAPLPVQIGDEEHAAPNTLAVGAHLKNAVALSVGAQVFISQHIGDLETEQASNAFRRVIADFQRLYDTPPDVVAADLHPDYLSTTFAEDLTGGARNPYRAADGGQRPAGPNLIQVQHHTAHVYSCMAENELQPPVLGVAWDGTGFGLDGTIWGGEFFLVTPEQVERVAHLRPFRLPGGDSAVREPRRAALGLLHALERDKLWLQARQKVAHSFSGIALSTIETLLQRGLNAPWTSSIGRLFDAVASLIGLRQKLRFEGQAAMELEFALEGIETDAQYHLSLVTHHGARILDWQPMIQSILTDVQHGETVGNISAKFHNTLVDAIIAVATEVGERRVVLSGGCFQNRYLTERTVGRLREEGFQPYWHQRIPPNDGGVALGQIVAARRAHSAPLITQRASSPLTCV